MGPRLNDWLALHAPPLAIPGFYGWLGLGFLLGALFYRARVEREPGALRALAESFPLAFIGSAVLPALVNLPGTWREPSRWLENGLVSYAGYVSGFAALWWRSRARGLDPLRLLDAVAPALGLGIFVGRMGCFVAGCDFGKPTLMPWGVRFPAHSAAWDAQVQDGWLGAFQPLSLPVHPTQLYESLLGLVVLAVGLRMAPGAPGRRFAGVALTYALGRSLIECFRGDVSRGALAGVSTAQWVSLAVALACLARLRARTVWSEGLT